MLFHVKHARERSADVEDAGLRFLRSGASYEELRAEFLHKASPPVMPLPITCTAVDREVRPRWLVRKVWK